MAARSSGMPPTSVYFVWPRRMASTAAALMRSGVSKSGSPAPKEMTSIPRARSSLALACTARVEDGARVFRRSASTARSLSAGWVLLGEALLDDRRHHPVDRRAEARHLLDEPGRDVRVLLVGHQEDRLHGRAQLAVHERHLELVLEVGDRPDPPHDAVGPLSRGQIDQQAVEGHDAEAGAE